MQFLVRFFHCKRYDEIMNIWRKISNGPIGVIYWEEFRKYRVHVHGVCNGKGSRQGLPLPLTL